MAQYSSYEEQVDHDTVNFHLAHLQELFRFFNARGIHEPGTLRRLKGRCLLSDSLWKISSANLRSNCKHNLRFYSEEAHALAARADRVPTSRKKEKIEHEHVIPRSVLERWLFHHRQEPNEIARLAACAIGCVVTVAEHKRLPEDPWGSIDPTSDRWRRYRNAKGSPIRIYDRLQRAFVDLTPPVER
jgi:hypothetical protein